jgi:hypothetical protein
METADGITFFVAHNIAYRDGPIGFDLVDVHEPNYPSEKFTLAYLAGGNSAFVNSVTNNGTESDPAIYGSEIIFPPTEVGGLIDIQTSDIPAYNRSGNNPIGYAWNRGIKRLYFRGNPQGVVPESYENEYAFASTDSSRTLPFGTPITTSWRYGCRFDKWGLRWRRDANSNDKIYFYAPCDLKLIIQDGSFAWPHFVDRSYQQVNQMYAQMFTIAGNRLRAALEGGGQSNNEWPTPTYVPDFSDWPYQWLWHSDFRLSHGQTPFALNGVVGNTADTCGQYFRWEDWWGGFGNTSHQEWVLPTNP